MLVLAHRRALDVPKGQPRVMLTLQNLGKSYGGRTLFEKVDLELGDGCRFGIVGANGSGKSTFMKVVAGDLSATDGSVHMPKATRMGVLRQDHFEDDGTSIVRVAMQGDLRTFTALEKRNAIIDRGEGDPAELADLEADIAMLEGSTLEARATAILEGLGIPRSQQPLPLSTLSGGFRLRVMLAQVLLGGPDLLLLDEPTNHLDILSIRWLETFLARHRGTTLVISHDQRFLDNVATHILDVDYGTIVPYTGNYTKFVGQKEREKARRDDEIARAEKIIAEKRAFVDRFGAKATKAKQAQSRLKQIEKIEVKDELVSSRRAPSFAFTAARPSGRDVLDIEKVGKSYGEKKVLTNLSLVVRRGEKVAIIGANGLGKSTLVKILADKLKQDTGVVKKGHEVRVGYFAQDHHELLPSTKITPLDYVWSAQPDAPTAQIRGELGRMLFSGDEVNKPVGTLSGGEAARVVFARISVEKPNLLLLDEPTNHLDMEAIEALAKGLKTFDGTVVFVSHDRWFVGEVASRIVEITAEGVRDFAGTYAEYLERQGDDHLDADAVVKRAKADRPSALPDGKGARPSAPPANEKAPGGGKPSAPPSAAPATPQLSWEEQKKRRNRKAALPKLRDAVMERIEEFDQRKKAIAAQFADPDFYSRATQAEQDKLMWEDKELVEAIDELTAEWEALEAELEALST
jgi:ATPase subunit of ABC transporter with duplicated ATPase domains